MTFVKGQPKPPNGGRKKGTPNKGSIRAKLLVAEADDSAIVKQVVDLAKGGSALHQSIYFRFLRPPAPKPKVNPTPVAVRTPKTVEEVREINGELLAKVLAGKLDLDAAQVAAGLLKAVETSIVGFDLQALLDDLKRRAE
jgi:hypothetical protein